MTDLLLPLLLLEGLAAVAAVAKMLLHAVAAVVVDVNGLMIVGRPKLKAAPPGICNCTSGR